MELLGDISWVTAKSSIAFVAGKGYLVTVYWKNAHKTKERTEALCLFFSLV
jgi:hypothetical protein